MTTEPIRLPARMSDQELLASLRAGEATAFAELCTRHAPALRRFARNILRADPAVADDVVQEALLRAHRALRRDDRQIDVKPYLYRLVRNCALDEIARWRTDSVALHLLHPGDEPASAENPHTLFERRDRLTTTLHDVAGLPETQRHALLRREIDGLSHEQVAAELGISAGASRNLVSRARDTLTRIAAARGADCDDVRADLLRAHDARRRASVSALRHVASCAGCRSFRTALRRERTSTRELAPPAFLLGGALLGGKASSTLAGAFKPVGAKVAAVAATAVVATGGAYALDTQVFGPGTRSPIRAVGVALPNGRLNAGQVVPAHTAVLTQRVRLPRSGPVPAAMLSCPPGMRVAGLVPEPADGRSHGLDAGTMIGVSRTAIVQFADHGPGAGQTVEVAILCREPDRAGSVRAAPATPSTAPLVHACPQAVELWRSRRGDVIGTAAPRESLAVVGGGGDWLRVQTGAGRVGWVRADAVC